MKKKTLLTSILTIVMCLSLMIGGTFALFTSESKVNVAVSSGKVNVIATIDQNSVETKKLYDTNYTAGIDNTYEGVATFNDEGLTLEKFIPGDGIKFNIVVKNESNVTVKYRTIISCENDNGLFAGLNITIDEKNYNSAKVVSNWEELTVGSNDAIVPVEIELPETAGDEYKEKTCTISYKVEAIQGNASVVSVDANGKTTAEKEVKDANGNKAIVFVGTAVKNGEIGLSLKVKELDETIADNVQTGYFELKDGNTAYAFNVTIPEVDENNETPIVVTMNTEKNLTDVVLFHKGDVMTEVASAADVDEHHEFYYDAVNGKITFATKNFSNFTLVSGLDGVEFVGDEASLKAALQNVDVKEVVFKNDITVNATDGGYSKAGIIVTGKTLNGNGYVLKVNGANSNWDCGIYTNGATIKNILISNAFRGVFTAGQTSDIILENVSFDEVCYNFNADNGNNQYGLYAIDCTFAGWTSYGTVFKEVKFTNCTFTQGNYYTNVYGRLVKPYMNTEFYQCEFNSKFYIDLSSIKDSKIILSQCTVNGVEITADNIESLVVAEDVCGEGQITIESPKGTYDYEDWKDSVNIPKCVYSFADLKAALNAGGNVILGSDIEVFNEAITIDNGVESVLFMNDKTITGTFNNTGNQEMFLVKGKLTVKDGTINMAAENNQEWDAMATIFDVTAGGVLKLEGINASVLGTDMNFIVHLNNWGTATADINNCNFNLSYVAVRAFNSGYDMNTVTIKNTNVATARLFWVQNYTAEGKDDTTLTLDIYNNNNTCDNAKPIRFGFTNPTYCDINGNDIA
ncbi:MAG: hypothetical protein IKW33_02680 [Clostridia bacterium]|nr:hypothetical protein [Clostridia bacterium]